MSEAFVALDRIADGIQHLNPELVTDINTIPTEQQSDKGNLNHEHGIELSLFKVLNYVLNVLNQNLDI
jgi:hypothetical protein